MGKALARTIYDGLLRNRVVVLRDGHVGPEEAKHT